MPFPVLAVLEKGIGIIRITLERPKGPEREVDPAHIPNILAQALETIET